MAITIKRRNEVANNQESRVTKKRTTLGERRMANKKEQAPTKSRISLWDVESDNERAPIARGTIQLTAEVVEELYDLVQEGTDFVELGVSIWLSDSENERAPKFTGLIKSPSEREAEIAQAKSKGASKSSRKGKQA